MGLQSIKTRVTAAAQTAGRDGKSITLVAVSKVQPNLRIQTVLDEGHRCFGENRVQEAADKWPQFRADYAGVDLHLLGPLQTNKARQAVQLFDCIHSLDRLKLANTLARVVQEEGKCPKMFVQVNTGGEAQKAGVLPGAVDQFVADCRAMDLPVIGLMCIPPVDEEASLHFALMAKLAVRNGLDGLSMGMSADFENAIAFGATHIRVGSAIFGDRIKQ